MGAQGGNLHGLQVLHGKRDIIRTMLLKGDVKRWFQNDLWLNKSVQNGPIQNVSIRLLHFHEI